MNGSASNRGRAAWTLVELLVALSILLVLGGLMLGLFTGAWNSWHGIARSTAWTTRAADWVAQFDADVSSAQIAGDLGLTGDAAQLQLLRPAHRRHPALVHVAYTWDGNDTVSRIETEWAWPATGSRGVDQAAAAATRQRFATFALAYGSLEEGGRIAWRHHWHSPTNTPDAVRVQFTAPDTGTAIEHIVPLPPGPAFPPMDENTQTNTEN